MTNKITPVLVLFFLLIAISSDLLADSSKVYSIGVVPQFEVKKLRSIWKPILKELEQSTGLKFKLKGAPTIPAFEKELLAGKYDFSYMNPFHFLIANESNGYLPLVRDHSKKLQGVLVVRKDSDIKTISDLNNRTLAFPSPNALGASLQMRAELRDNFNINFTPRYVKTHDSVYLNVFLKKTAAGGGVGKTLQKQPINLRRALKTIYKTTPVFPHPFAVHPRVSNKDREKVFDALIDLSKTPAGKKILAQIPIKMIGKASMKDYRQLKAMNLKRFYVSK